MSWDLTKKLTIGDIISYHPNKINSNISVDERRTITGVFNGFIECNNCNIGIKCKGMVIIDNNKPLCIGFGSYKCRIVAVINKNFIEEEEFMME